MKKISYVIIVLFLGGLSIFVVGRCIRENHKNEKIPEFVFTYAENQSEDYPTTLGGFHFAALVEERTEGRIRIIVYANGELGDEKSVIQQIQFGGIDFGRVSLSPLAEHITKLNVLQMPYLYDDAEHMWSILDGTIGKDFFDSFSGSDMVALSWYDAGARNFYNSVRPITCLEDMKNLKIRVQESDLMVDMVEALGAVAVPFAYGDVYSGLETGSIDGAENNWPSYESTEHYEVAKYYTIDEHTRVPEVQICAQTTWNQLSEADQQLIMECAKESAIYERELWIQREKQSRNALNESGLIITELTELEKEKFKEAVQPVYATYCTAYMDIIDEINDCSVE